MSDSASSSLNAFQQWILKSFGSLGVEVASEVDPLGLEFESEGRIVRVLPHTDAALAVLQAEVSSLEDADELSLARIAILMLRLNDEARFEHQWQITLDVDDRLCISMQINIAETNAEQLAELLQEGLERAAMLGDSFPELTALVAEASSPESAHLGSSGLVRG